MPDEPLPPRDQSDLNAEAIVALSRTLLHLADRVARLERAAVVEEQSRIITPVDVLRGR